MTPPAAPVPTPNWTHPGTVVRVIDGDTLVIRLDLGRYPVKIEAEASIRIADLHAPELKEPGGIETRAYVMDLVGGYPAWTDVVVQTRKPNPSDPYGRIVADVWLPDGTSIATAVSKFITDHGYGPGR
jgi:endonuclease YncB( thermonuclease family)